MKTLRNFLVVLFVLGGLQTFAQTKELDVPYVPTNQAVVDAMLDLAGIKSGDIHYDLGCGDGRIVISAAKRGAIATGIDLDPQRIKEANANAQAAGLADKVKFIEGDLFDFDFSKADVLTLYLLPSVNLKLRPKIMEELRPGTRVVSHAFDMGDWEPEREIEMGGDKVFLWIVPEKE